MPSQAWAKRGGRVSVYSWGDKSVSRRVSLSSFQFLVERAVNSMLSLKSVIGFTGEQTRPIAHFTPCPKYY
eukprot:scaffold19087_cov30-Cyclotella_meneghiniana.AAC.1